MAVFVPCLNTLEVAVQYIQNQEPVLNTYHVQNTGAWDAAAALDCLSVFFLWEDVGYSGSGVPKNNRSSTTELVSATGRDLTTLTGLRVEDIPSGGPIVGQDTNPPLPNNVTIALKAATNVAGRSFRGRTYWIGMTEFMIDPAEGQTIKAAILPTLTGAMTALVHAIHATNPAWTMVVCSKHHNGVPRAAGLMTPVQAYTAKDGYLDSMRRRLPAHNRHH